MIQVRLHNIAHFLHTSTQKPCTRTTADVSSSPISNIDNLLSNSDPVVSSESRNVSDAIPKPIVFRCHSDRVKAVTSERGNGDLFWSCSEDGILHFYVQSNVCDTFVPCIIYEYYQNYFIMQSLKHIGDKIDFFDIWFLICLNALQVLFVSSIDVNLIRVVRSGHLHIFQILNVCCSV